MITKLCYFNSSIIFWRKRFRRFFIIQFRLQMFPCPIKYHKASCRSFFCECLKKWRYPLSCIPFLYLIKFSYFSIIYLFIYRIYYGWRDENNFVVCDEDGEQLIHTDGTGYISEDLAILCAKDFIEAKGAKDDSYEVFKFVYFNCSYLYRSLVSLTLSLFLKLLQVCWSCQAWGTITSRWFWCLNHSCEPLWCLYFRIH